MPLRTEELIGTIRQHRPGKCWNGIDHPLQRALARSKHLFGPFPVVDIGRCADEFEDLPFLIAQCDGSVEMPAIGPIPTAEKPRFHREALSCAYPLPKRSRG